MMMTTKINDGGSAFPFAATDQSNVHMQQPGMSLRDWFAGQALASFAGENPNLPGDKASHTDWPSAEELAMRRAVWSYLQADAMLAARDAMK